MTNRLLASFRKALKVALANRRDVARALGRGYRTVQSYERGERRITVEAARALARYLRSRARAFQQAAAKLEAVADKEGKQG